MTVKIYLRSILKRSIVKGFIVEDEKKSLALFDSNRNGDINDLITDVKAGATIIWKLDCCSGIKSITRIYSKEEKHLIFKSEPRKLLFCKGFRLRLEKEEVKEELIEKYGIECILCDGKVLKIDPMIRVPPPPEVH
jgi:hypothetical protein